jgi:hypothetical protein
MDIAERSGIRFEALVRGATVLEEKGLLERVEGKVSNAESESGGKGKKP